MWKNKITVWFLHGSEGALKQLHIRKAWLIYVPAAVLLLVIFNFFSLSAFFGEKVNQAEMARLRQENRQLADRYEKIRYQLADINGRLENLTQKETAIRSMFDLPQINSQERELGTGGPVPESYVQMTAAQQSVAMTEAEVDRMLKQAEFELQKYGEIETALGGLKIKLDHTPSIWPAKGWSSRGFGMHFDPFTGAPEMHKGIDIANHVGSPIISTALGKVVYAGFDPGGLGNMIAIDHGYGFMTRYGHLSKVLVKYGQMVKRGDLIGLMGSSGYSTGPHLHYEVFRNGAAVNPMRYILN